MPPLPRILTQIISLLSLIQFGANIVESYTFR